MARRAPALALILALVLSGTLASVAQAAPARPASMAATGDSITRAFNLCFFPFTDCPSRSWSTGSNSTVRSHAYRLGITGSASNDAVSGARMVDLPSQASTVAGRNVDYVTILMGGNDVCTDGESLMTTPAAYERDFRAALDRLAAAAKRPLVYVVSVPNVKMLWEILKDDSSARSAWSTYDICQSLLASPLSTAQADVDRRERVKQRNMELNGVLRRVCAEYEATYGASAAYGSFCRFDGEAAFGTAFVPADVSTRDYFHPSTAGQTKLASVSYDHGYWGTQAVNAAPTAGFAASCSGLTCTFTDASTDADGVAGWSWNFDASAAAGPTSTLQHPSHTFSAAGSYTVTLYAIDRRGATARASQTVTVSDTAPSTGSVAGTVTDAGTGAAIGGATVSVDGTGLTATTGPDGTYSIGSVPTGTYTVTASAAGYVDASKDASVSADTTTTVDFALVASGGGTSPTPMHVADLDGSSARATRGHSWTASVTIRVVSETGANLEGAEVSGDWSTGGSSTCTTGTAGTCSVSVSLNSRKVTSTTFTVAGIVLAGHAYTPSLNGDPDGDSNGTSITVQLL